METDVSEIPASSASIIWTNLPGYNERHGLEFWTYRATKFNSDLEVVD
jgi:hypothetical protein